MFSRSDNVASSIRRLQKETWKKIKRKEREREKERASRSNGQETRSLAIVISPLSNVRRLTCCFKNRSPSLPALRAPRSGPIAPVRLENDSALEYCPLRGKSDRPDRAHSRGRSLSVHEHPSTDNAADCAFRSRSGSAV